MSIVAAELEWYQPAVRNDTTSNGGRMTATVITSGVKNNIWPDVPQAERIAGSNKYRKVFIKVSNDDDDTLFSSRIFVETFTPGDDAVLIFAGTQTDTQNDLTGSERLYGSGQLAANVSAAATVITVDTEGASFNYFQDGDTIRISDKTDVNDNVNNEEFATIVGTPSYSSDQATITLIHHQWLL